MISLVKKIISKSKAIKLEIDRLYAHGYRLVTGSPLGRFSLITPQVYLGGQYSLAGFKKILAEEFTAIVNMREISIHDAKALEETNIKYLQLPTVDLTAPTIEDLQAGINFITKEVEAGGKVYVHCMHGEGRGPSMVLAYLISTGMLLDDALATVRSVRSFIRPTKVQLERLREIENIYKQSFKIA